MSQKKLKWKGDEVLRRVERAAILGVDATMSAAVLNAKANHGAAGGGRSRVSAIGHAQGQGRFISRTGELERSTRVVRPAKRSGSGVSGRWGSKGVIYARRIELGFQGQDSAGRVVNAPAYPFLFPAADAEYPKLGKRIKAAYRRGL